MTRPVAVPGLDLGADAYRRRILVATVATGVVTAALEDDFHRFAVELHHEGGHVASVDADSARYPWSTCPAAAESLRALVGMPLADRFTAAAAWADPHLACTHQFDLAALAVTHATAGRDRRQYDVEVPARDRSGCTHVRLFVDGEPDLAWDLSWTGIVDPEPPFDAAPWKGGFMRWADAHLPPDAAERAIVLRRASDIGMGRHMPLDDYPTAADVPAPMTGVCYSMQPGTMEVALRQHGKIRDFATHPERLLADGG